MMFLLSLICAMIDRKRICCAAMLLWSRASDKKHGELRVTWDYYHYFLGHSGMCA